jgi:hypothetical protein
MGKVYHIYAKDECIYHSLTEDEFKSTWNTLINMVGLMKTDYNESDFSYEELTINKEVIWIYSKSKSTYKK